MPIYHKIFEKTEEKEGMLTTHFLEARITLIRKPNKRITRKENQTNIFHEHEPEHIFHRATSFMIPSKILAGWIQYIRWPVGLLPGMQVWVRFESQLM